MAGTRFRVSQVIEASVLNLLKVDCCCTDEVYVVHFVPCYQVPTKRPCAFNPLLEPLIQDLENSFVKGTKVKYGRDICGHNAGETIVCCMLLCWTGDYPAQREVGKFINCGILPCRRHHLRGTNIANQSTYYFANNRYHAVSSQNSCLEDEEAKMSEIFCSLVTFYPGLHFLFGICRQSC